MVIHDEIGTNRSYTWDLKIEESEGDVDRAFADAAYSVKERYIQQRLIPAAMEPRAVAAIPQPFGGDMTLYSSTQVPHILKVMTALTLGIPEHQLRVVAPAVGGGERRARRARSLCDAAAAAGSRFAGGNAPSTASAQRRRRRG